MARPARTYPYTPPPPKPRKLRKRKPVDAYSGTFAINHRRAWEKFPDEPGKAYAMFSAYMNLPADQRTFVAAYRAYKNDESIPKPPLKVYQLAEKFEWKERAAAWDLEVTRREQEARLKALQERARLWEQRRLDMIEAEYKTGELLMQKAREMLAFPLVEETYDRETPTFDGEVLRQTVIQKPTNWRMRDAAAILSTGSQIMRRAQGMVTDIIGVSDASEQSQLEKARALVVETLTLFSQERPQEVFAVANSLFGVTEAELMAFDDVLQLVRERTAIDIDAARIDFLPEGDDLELPGNENAQEDPVALNSPGIVETFAQLMAPPETPEGGNPAPPSVKPLLFWLDEDQDDEAVMTDDILDEGGFD